MAGVCRIDNSCFWLVAYILTYSSDFITKSSFVLLLLQSPPHFVTLLKKKPIRNGYIEIFGVLTSYHFLNCHLKILN